jgi:hypothetical protein
MKCLHHQVRTRARGESLSCASQQVLVSRRHVDLMRVVSAACR